jgi:hypothetical protein
VGPWRAKKCDYSEGKKKQKWSSGTWSTGAGKEAKIRITAAFLFSGLQRPSREFFARVCGAAEARSTPSEMAEKTRRALRPSDEASVLSSAHFRGLGVTVAVSRSKRRESGRL